MTSSLERDVPLKVLICDAERETAAALAECLRISPAVLAVTTAQSIEQATQSTASVNAIFVDPLSLGLDEASAFIFRVRAELPEIVFALYVDRAQAESMRSLFYRGERSRFTHYFTLDKRTSVNAFAAEVDALVKSCQADLRLSLSTASLQRLRAEADKLAGNGTADLGKLVDMLQRGLAGALAAPPSQPQVRNPRSVFVSHRFQEQEYFDGLKRLLERDDFEVVTASATDSHVGEAIIRSITESNLFVSLMTRADAKADGTYTTSPWLLEEKGVALAQRKRLVIMIEDGVSDYGALQGDWQRIHFSPKGFTVAALQAVEQLKSYVGAGT